MITTKWQNIRDAFIRSLKNRSGQGYTKKYIYSDQLKFLLKIVQKDDTESSINESELFKKVDDIEKNIENDIESLSNEIMQSPEHSKSTIKKNKRQLLDDALDREILKSLKATPTPPDEDESFFNSVLPSIKKMSEDEKFDFRIGVLNLIQSIKKSNQAIQNQRVTPLKCNSDLSEFIIVESED